jgi:hypothetical protein
MLRLRSGLVFLFLVGLLASGTPALGQSGEPTASSSTTKSQSSAPAKSESSSTESPSPSPAPVLPISGGAVFLIVIAAAAIFLAWGLPLAVDAHRAYVAQRDVLGKMLERLERAAAKDGLTLDELKAFLPVVVRPAEGMRGLARVLLAFLVTSIVAVITLALLFSSAPGVFEVIKQIVTALLGILATIIGFYFGARTAEGAAAAAVASPGGTTTTPGTVRPGTTPGTTPPGTTPAGTTPPGTTPTGTTPGTTPPGTAPGTTPPGTPPGTTPPGTTPGATPAGTTPGGITPAGDSTSAPQEPNPAPEPASTSDWPDLEPPQQM